MFAVYATHASVGDPLASLALGERPDPEIPDGWCRVTVTHASLNRHDLFTLQGITGHPEGAIFPRILGNDAAGVLDDGTPVVLYPVMGTDGWKGDETLDPHWHVFSELVDGTMADYVAAPRRNAIPLPDALSAQDAAVLGTAWLTAYRALFTKSGLRPGDTLLVQGGTGGMATALVQLGRAAGFEVWVTSRTEEGRDLAERLGAHRTFGFGQPLPHKVRAVVDNIGPATFDHSLNSLTRGGTLVVTGVTTGMQAAVALLNFVNDQLTVTGSIMGTMDDMQNLLTFVATAGIAPHIGGVLPMERAEEAVRAMWNGDVRGKVVLTR